MQQHETVTVSYPTFYEFRNTCSYDSTMVAEIKCKIYIAYLLSLYICHKEHHIAIHLVPHIENERIDKSE